MRTSFTIRSETLLQYGGINAKLEKLRWPRWRYQILQGKFCAAGAERCFRSDDRANSERVQPRRALDQLDVGDVLLVTRLDRSSICLGRSTRELPSRDRQRRDGFARLAA